MSGMSSIETPPASAGVVSLPSTNTSTPGMPNKQAEHLKRSNRELKKVQTEMRQLRKHVMQLNAQLESSETEMAAQRQELQRAAERMERDRLRHQEESEDLMDEHEDEMEQQKEHYEKLLDEQKHHFNQVVQDLSDRLNIEEEMRMQEGGDWTKELEDSLAREREALKKLGDIKEQHATLQSNVTKLQAQQNALQLKLESSVQNAQTASEREREAEDKLDAALSLHSRQLSQRQAREAELERTIADLGAALTVARQKEQNRAMRSNKPGESEIGYQKQYELAVDELETVRVQLSLETQRCEALRHELHEISQERTDDASAAHARQQQHDRRVADLRANVARLEATVRELKKSTGAPVTGESTSSEDPRVFRLEKESEELKRKVASVSEQLIRSQEKNESSKSEILALQNRLQAANTRAQNAEQTLAVAAPPPTTSQMYQVEGGGVSYGSGMRRRVKGGREIRSSVRSIRSALNMNPGRVGEGAEQVAATIDAIDSWVVDTGGFLRHEPLARLAFLLYLILLHLWAFCLVLFHAHSFEKEHADFGSLKMTNEGLPGELGHP
jgi:chromosome segregation ATPase